MLISRNNIEIFGRLISKQMPNLLNDFIFDKLVNVKNDKLKKNIY